MRPYLRRPDHLGGAVAPPPPVLGDDSLPEHKMQELLKFKMCWGRPYVLVRLVGHVALGDTWKPLDNLTNREEATAFERATGRSVALTAPPRPAAAGRRRRAAADSAGRFHSGPRATWRPSSGARGEDDPLLVVPGRVAARHHRPPLPAWRVLALRREW